MVWLSPMGRQARFFSSLRRRGVRSLLVSGLLRRALRHDRPPQPLLSFDELRKLGRKDWSEGRTDVPHPRADVWHLHRPAQIIDQLLYDERRRSLGCSQYLPTHRREAWDRFSGSRQVRGYVLAFAG